MAWDVWARLYPWMVVGMVKAKSFDEFRKEASRPVVSAKTPEEIETEMERIISAYEKKA